MYFWDRRLTVWTLPRPFILTTHLQWAWPQLPGLPRSELSSHGPFLAAPGLGGLVLWHPCYTDREPEIWNSHRSLHGAWSPNCCPLDQKLSKATAQTTASRQPQLKWSFTLAHFLLSRSKSSSWQRPIHQGPDRKVTHACWPGR